MSPPHICLDPRGHAALPALHLYDSDVARLLSSGWSRGLGSDEAIHLRCRRLEDLVNVRLERHLQQRVVATDRIQERRVVLFDIVVPSAVPIGFGQPIVMRDRHL